jgi:3'(2'), 5'-bisphosphate nucleotidase
MADINRLIDIAKQAGKIIMSYNKADFATIAKADKSPVTLADTAANDYIVGELAKYFPDIPIVSEEGAHDRHAASSFFLVDPLDGTKGFVSGGGEFTVNIGLIEEFEAKKGVIYVPASGELYYGTGKKAFKNGEEIRCRKMPHDGIVIVASRNHKSKETDHYIENLRHHYTKLRVTAAASSLKFCLVAEGKADIYPRYGKTMEWDTAAGQAILQSAGGSVVTPEGHPFHYGKNQLFENGWFIARGLG